MSLPARWYPLRAVPAQLAYANSPHRFNVVPAGRRSGKTERAKRKLVRKALSLDGITHGELARFFAAAPTRDQAKRIYWDDLKELSRPWWSGRPSETELTLKLITGAELVVVGLDKPERIEGSPWDGGILDEYANMKARTWGEHVRPALSDRNGWCDLIGVPEGRNHYFDAYNTAVAEMAERGASSEWGAYSWPSSDVLPPEEIAAAKRDLDELTFQQEYEASFVNFVGRAYYPFLASTHAAYPLKYDATKTLILCFDFNVDPGVAVVCQEQNLPSGRFGTAVIGEVWIPQNSNTPAVCRRLVQDWGHHSGLVECFGDATGGARGTAQVQGSDWDLVRQELKAGFRNIQYNVNRENPRERARVNAVNSRLKAADGTVRLMVDPTKAPHVVRDLEGVRVLEGGSGEIDKKRDPKLTHPSDALGYYIEDRYPLTGGGSAFTTYRN